MNSARVIEGDCLATLRTLPDGRFRKGIHAYRQPRPHWRREWLLLEYVTKQKSAGDIAADIGCTEANVLFWLRKHDIARRTIAQARKAKRWGPSGEANPMHGKTGAANPRYVDGSSPERQRMYAQGVGRAFLRAIYARDSYRCVRCGAGKTAPRSLHAHHIAPWADNPALRFDANNAVTLCRPCHHWVHSNANSAREFLR
jgi:hypothetical protein